MPDDLPSGLVAYKRTALFDEVSLPAGLRRAHSTRPGVWALIHVVEGALLYRIPELDYEQRLEPGVPGVVRPEQLHDVTPLGAVKFYVEFHAAQPPGGAPHREATGIG